ncbi:MAG: hypothetical protein NC910_04555, partial [Candidatus Omnitrophica bacterium]|nr:hypothetical protein [Candidatus Omnitrophota bacterium]
MKKTGWTRKILTGVLTFSLIVGQAAPSFALRGLQVSEQDGPGLTELTLQIRRQGLAPAAAGLEEGLDRRQLLQVGLATLLGSPVAGMLPSSRALADEPVLYDPPKVNRTPFGYAETGSGRGTRILPGAHRVYVTGSRIFAGDRTGTDIPFQRRWDPIRWRYTSKEWLIGVEGTIHEESSLRKFYVYIDRPYNWGSREYVVAGADNAYTLAPNPTSTFLGIVAGERNARGEVILYEEGKPLYGLVGYTAYRINPLPKISIGRTPSLDVVPAGILVQKIPVATYLEYAEKGKPYPLKWEGYFRYGTVYEAGFSVGGGVGRSFYGNVDLKGDILPPLYEQTRRGPRLVQKELRSVYNDKTGEWELTFRDHPISVKEPDAPAEEKRDRSGPEGRRSIQGKEEPGHLLSPLAQRVLGVPVWVWIGGISIGGGAAIELTLRMIDRRIRAARESLEQQTNPPDSQESPPVSSAGLEENESRGDSRPWQRAALPLTVLAALFGGLLVWLAQPSDMPINVDVLNPPGAGKDNGQPPKAKQPQLPPTPPKLPIVNIPPAADDAALKEYQKKLLEESQVRPPIQIELAKQWAGWINLQYAKGYMSRLDSDYAKLELERAPVVHQENKVLKIQQQFLSAPPKDRTKLWSELHGAIDEQIQAEISYWNDRLKLDTWSHYGTIKLTEGILGAKATAKAESLQHLREKVKIHIKQLEELRLLYGDLQKIGSYLPLPGMIPQGASLLDIREMVPAIEPYGRPLLTKDEKEKLNDSVRKHIDRLLELEEEITVSDDVIASNYYHWAKLQKMKGYIAGRDFDFAEDHQKLNEVRAAGRGVLKAQRQLVMAKTPEDQYKAQKALDQANRTHLKAMMDRYDNRIKQREVWAAYTSKNKLLPAWIGTDDELSLELEKIERKGLDQIAKLYDALNGLGLPTFPLAPIESRTSLLDFNSLVPPIVIGTPTPADAAEAQKLQKQAEALPEEIKKQQISFLQSKATKLTTQAHKNTMLYLAANPKLARIKGYMSGIQAANWEDSRMEAVVMEKQAMVVYGLIGLIKAGGDSAKLKAARKVYEEAIFAQIDAELERVDERLYFRENQLKWASTSKYAPLSHKIYWQELVIEDTSLKKQLTDQKAFYQELQKKEIPLPALGRAVSTNPSPDNLQIFTGAKTGTSISGSVLVAKEGKLFPHTVIVGDGQWIWLSRPRFLEGDRNISTERVTIPKGLPGAGNTLPKERIIKVAAFTADGPREYYIAVLGFWTYEEQSGYYWVVGGDGVITVPAVEAVRLGVLVKRDEADPLKMVAPTHGLTGYISYQIQPFNRPKGKTFEVVPVGIITQEVPLEVYNAKGKDGREAPIPLSPIKVGEDGTLEFGRLYKGGAVTYGPKGEAFWGKKMNDQGEKLPILYQGMIPPVLVEPEVRIVVPEPLGIPQISVYYHQVQLKAPAAGLEGEPRGLPEQLRSLGAELQGAVVFVGQVREVSRYLKEVSFRGDEGGM